MNKSNQRYGNEQKNAELVLPREVQNVKILLYTIYYVCEKSWIIKINSEADSSSYV